jgi:hypothetical protein
MKRTPLLRKSRIRLASLRKIDRMDMTGLAVPKPKKRRPKWITIYADGREKLNIKTAQGANEYHWRKWEMRDRQNLICCLFGFISECPGYLKPCDTSFEHEDGRGGGKQDDRTEKNGRPYNGASHFQCNTSKGSRFVDFNGNRKLREAIHGEY